MKEEVRKEVNLSYLRYGLGESGASGPKKGCHDGNLQ